MQLDEIRGAPPNEAELSNQFRAMSMEQRGDASKTWAAWAPGLKLARATAINNNIQVLEKRGPDMLHQYHLELTAGNNQLIKFQCNHLNLIHFDHLNNRMMLRWATLRGVAQSNLHIKRR